MSELLNTYKAASKQAHVKVFDITAGGETHKVSLPRLSIARQAQFEMLVRKTVARFSLSAMRQKLQLAQGKCNASAIEEIRAEGLPARFKNKEEAGLWEALLKARMMAKFSDAADALFDGITAEHQAEAVALSLQQQEHARELEGVPLNAEFVEGLLAEEGPNTLAKMALWVLGIAGSSEEEATEPAETGEELIEKVAGDPKEPSSPQPENSTTQSSSPSSEEPSD